MKHFDNIDDLFEQVNQHSLAPADRVWQAVNADQRRKRRLAAWWWLPVVAVVAGGGWGLWAWQNPTVAPAVATPVAMQQAVTPKQVKTAPHPIEVSNTLQPTASKLPATHWLNRWPVAKHRPHPSLVKLIPQALPPTTAVMKLPAAETTVPEPTPDAPQKKNPAATLNQNTHTQTVAEPDKNSPPIQETNKNPEPDHNKNKEKTFQRLYVEASLPLVRSFRVLQASDSAFATHTRLRNSSEITLNTVGATAAVVYMLTPKSSLGGGLMYLGQGLSSSFRDTFGGIAVNGDQRFHFLKVPLVYTRYLTLKNRVYLVGGGLTVNMLLAARGTVLDLNASAPGQLASLANQPVKSFGSELCLKLGTTQPLLPGLDLVANLAGAFSPFSVFKSNYPVQQLNYYYGLELGLRKRL